MWDPPGPGLKPVSPALAGRFLTTAPPGKPSGYFLLNNCFFNAFLSFHIILQAIRRHQASPSTLCLEITSVKHAFSFLTSSTFHKTLKHEHNCAEFFVIFIKFITFSPLSYNMFPLPSSLWLFSISVSLHLLCIYIHLYYFLDFTYKWYHTILKTNLATYSKSLKYEYTLK